MVGGEETPVYEGETPLKGGGGDILGGRLRCEVSRPKAK